MIHEQLIIRCDVELPVASAVKHILKNLNNFSVAGNLIDCRENTC